MSIQARQGSNHSIRNVPFPVILYYGHRAVHVAEARRAHSLDVVAEYIRPAGFCVGTLLYEADEYRLSLNT